MRTETSKPTTKFYVLDDCGFAQKSGAWIVAYDASGRKVGAKKSFAAAGLLVGWVMPKTAFTLQTVESLPGA